MRRSSPRIQGMTERALVRRSVWAGVARATPVHLYWVGRRRETHLPTPGTRCLRLRRGQDRARELCRVSHKAPLCLRRHRSVGYRNGGMPHILSCPAPRSNPWSGTFVQLCPVALKLEQHLLLGNQSLRRLCESCYTGLTMFFSQRAPLSAARLRAGASRMVSSHRSPPSLPRPCVATSVQGSGHRDNDHASELRTSSALAMQKDRKTLKYRMASHWEQPRQIFRTSAPKESTRSTWSCCNGNTKTAFLTTEQMRHEPWLMPSRVPG
jgi:hypothetical protein